MCQLRTKRSAPGRPSTAPEPSRARTNRRRIPPALPGRRRPQSEILPPLRPFTLSIRGAAPRNSRRLQVPPSLRCRASVHIADRPKSLQFANKKGKQTEPPPAASSRFGNQAIQRTDHTEERIAPFNVRA